MWLSGFVSFEPNTVMTSDGHLVMQMRRIRPRESSPTTSSPDPIYDDITENAQKKEIIELTSNVAYAATNN